MSAGGQETLWPLIERWLPRSRSDRLVTRGGGHHHRSQWLFRGGPFSFGASKEGHRPTVDNELQSWRLYANSQEPDTRPRGGAQTPRQHWPKRPFTLVNSSQQFAPTHLIYPLRSQDARPYVPIWAVRGVSLGVLG